MKILKISKLKKMNLEEIHDYMDEFVNFSIDHVSEVEDIIRDRNSCSECKYKNINDSTLIDICLKCKRFYKNGYDLEDYFEGVK